MSPGRFVLLAWFAVPLAAQTHYTAASIADGGRLFRANCVVCHGPEGDMVQGVDLGHGKFRRASSDEGLIKIIQNGIPGTAMPPHTMTDFQAGTIVAYLRSMAAVGRARAAKGDAARGKVLFETRGGCVNCHRVDGHGSRMGPDLSEIGALRRAVELEQSILDPNREILPQNRYYRVTTRDGQTITGRLLNQDSFTIQLLDSKERLVSLERSELKDGAFLKESPMPSYKGKLSADELDDLVAYLVSLKGVVTRP